MKGKIEAGKEQRQGGGTPARGMRALAPALQPLGLAPRKQEERRWEGKAKWWESRGERW